MKSLGIIAPELSINLLQNSIIDIIIKTDAPNVQNMIASVYSSSTTTKHDAPHQQVVSIPCDSTNLTEQTVLPKTPERIGDVVTETSSIEKSYQFWKPIDFDICCSNIFLFQKDDQARMSFLGSFQKFKTNSAKPIHLVRSYLKSVNCMVLQTNLINQHTISRHICSQNE